MPTKTQEQQDRFVDHIQPMPVPAALVERIRKDCEYAKQLAQRAREESLTADNTGQHKTDTTP